VSFPINEENKRLIAKIKYLTNRAVMPYKFSVAREKGINTTKIKASLGETV
jgi:hypothetical protein